MTSRFERAARRLAAGVALGGLALTATGAETDGVEPAAWRRTLERIATAVVSIQVDATRAFDTEWNESNQATGFVVDAERGLVLTNRHVVTTGPVRAGALFINQEEVELTPVYRDPVHDFGFFRYDPASLKYIRPVSLPLHPERAGIGREVRVVGNDAGEQLSILSGTLARLRRDAPAYGRNQYNDFNTFYIQAASGTSGGSSGSPVIDIGGRVVALNAGASNEAASSFFLPLDRVQRALDLIRGGRPVSRGTLGTVFRYTAFDELRRLGLQEATEAAIRRRFPEGTGMLVAAEVLPGSPADGQLEVGDILVRLEGEHVTEFVPLEASLDERVGRRVSVTVERGGRTLPLALQVGDLHALTPDEYLQFGDAVLHDLSYQQARHYNRPVTGVFVANPGFVFAAAGIPRGSIVLAFDGEPVANLDDLERILARLADRQRAIVRYAAPDEPASSRVRVIRMDRRWFAARRCHRDDARGIWPCEPLAAGPAPRPPEAGSTRFGGHRDPRLRRIAPSLVLVNFDMPYEISGVSEQHYYGTGLVVDAQRGYVAVDRNTVPEAMGDVRVTFGGSLEIPARVEYIHPTHNLALVAYDPALIGDTPVVAARFARHTPDPGEPVWVAGLRNGQKLAIQGAAFSSLEPVTFPLSRTLRFRESNLETLQLVNGPTDMDGVVLDRRGDVVAMWSSFAWQGTGELHQANSGMPAEYVQEMVELAATNRPLHSMEVEWTQVPLAAARRLGLSADRAMTLAQQDPERRQALSVLRTVAGTPAAAVLQPGDLLLTMDGVPVTRFRDTERLAQQPAVALEVLRDGALMTVDVGTVPLAGTGTRRVLLWAGALLQDPYRDMAAQRGVEPTGVYVSYFAFGSPASRYGLYAGRRITAMDGEPVADLADFIERVQAKAAGAAGRGSSRTKRASGSDLGGAPALPLPETVRLTTVTWNNQLEVLTLKLDDAYWPACEIRWEDGEWRRVPLTATAD